MVDSLTMMMIIGGMTLGREVAEQEEEEVIGSLVVIGALAGLHREEAETGLFLICVCIQFNLIFYFYYISYFFSFLHQLPLLNCIDSLVL